MTIRERFCCPICGNDEPGHRHDPDQLEYFNSLTSQERIDRAEMAELIAGTPQTKMMTADKIIRAGWRKIISDRPIPIAMLLK